MSKITTRATQITKKDSSRILYRVVNQITQKFSLNSDAKQKITDFVAKHVDNEIKVVFPKNGLPDGDFEYATVPLGEKELVLAYNSTSDKKESDTILYVVLKEKDKKNNNISNIEEFVTISSEEQDKILTATFERLINQLKVNLGLTLDLCAKDKIYNFLVSQAVNGRIGVIFTYKLPAPEQYSGIKIQSGESVVELLYGVNPVKNFYPNVLWVNVSKPNADLDEQKLLELKKAEFYEFWNNNNLPQELFEQALKNVDVTKRITIAVYSSIETWNKCLKVERNSVVIIGQHSSKKMENKAVGYVKGNHIVIGFPENLRRLVCYEFK